MRKIKAFLMALLGFSQYRDTLDENHLNDPRRRRFTAPRTAASQLLAILNSEPRFGREIMRLNNPFTLVRFAVVGQELRMLAYRATTDLDESSTYSIFDPSWQMEGTFHYLVTDGEIELLVRNSMPALRYNPYEPQIAWTMPLTAKEVVQFHDSWLATTA
jgi:hypothetical protein